MWTYRLHFGDDVASDIERLRECPGSNERAFHLHRQLFRDVAEWLQFLHVRVDADQIPANENGGGKERGVFKNIVVLWISRVYVK